MEAGLRIGRSSALTGWQLLSVHLSGCFHLLEIPWEIVPFYGTAFMQASTLKNGKIAKDGDSSSWLP